MKKMFMVLLAGSLVACGMEEKKPVIEEVPEGQSVKSDPYLQQYMNHFYGICITTTAANRCKENLKKFTSIRFVDSFDKKADPDGTVAGICWWSRFQRRVEIKRNAVQAGSMRERGLIFHELGHCLLDLGHSNPETKMMMNPILLDEKTYTSNWSKLQKELFQIVLSLFGTQDFDLDDDKEIPLY